MSSVDSITQSLAGLSIRPVSVLSHSRTNSPATWREALEASPSAPKSFELIKTLVYKPKTAKTATPVPVVVVAREGTDVISGTLGKKLGLKELRLGSEDLLKEFFSLDKISRTCLGAPALLYASPLILPCVVSPLALNEQTSPKVTTVLDSTIASSSSVFAVHALSSSETIFLTGKDIQAYLKRLETQEAPLHDIDFESLKTDIDTASPAGQAKGAPVKEKKDDAKIEGAIQIAIGIKKEVDFAAWYTNVSAERRE